MPARWRVVYAMGGSVLFFVGALLGYDSVYWEASTLEQLPSALAGGLGLGMLATAFLPRD